MNVKQSGSTAGEDESWTLSSEQCRQMLAAVGEAQALFIEEPGRPAFNRLLETLLDLTGSEYGLIGEVLTGDDGKHYLRERAILSGSLNPAVQSFIDRNYKPGFELHELDNLFGSVITEAHPVIINHALPGTMNARTRINHPHISTFFGIPLLQWDEVVGVVCLVNRPGGYHETLLREMEPISMSCANLILASRNFSARQQMENTIFESERKHRLLFENSRDALMMLAPPGWNFASANQSALQLFGAESKHQFNALSLADVSPANQSGGRTSSSLLKDHIELALRDGTRDFEWKCRRIDGATFDAWILLLRVESAGMTMLQVTVRDITTQHETKRALQHESEKSEMLLRVASDGVHILDPGGSLKLMSDSFCRMLGYSRYEMQGMDASQWDLHWADPEQQSKFDNLPSKGMTYETRYRRKDGSQFEVEVSANSIRLDDIPMLYCSSRDITERKAAEKDFIHQATYDVLTQLPNRSLFRDRLEQEMKKSHRSGWPMALMLIDLDHFKEVNDTLGHDKGDKLLIEAARRILSCVRESDTVARLGGDEFTVILSELDDSKDVDRVVEKIVKRLAAPFQLGDEQAFISASVGITLYPDDATDIEELLKNADQAMYLAKKEGRNRFSFFTSKLQEAAQRRMRLTNDLRTSLAAGNQFLVYYQPIIELTTGNIHKAEALIRWQHPQRGMVSPAEFIPLAEETGMIVELGDWIFQQAMQQCKQWRERFHPNFQVSVNRSPVQFQHDMSHSKEWITYLSQSDIPGQCLVIEITEGLLLNVEGSVGEKLLAFRDAGVQVAIDDFGTGYSSLSYLNKLDIDYLKIDQSFVRNLGSSASDLALCEAIVIMAHKLGLKTIAEGVSSEVQHDLLLQIDCDYVQGFLYSRPVPAEEFEKLFPATNDTLARI